MGRPESKFRQEFNLLAKPLDPHSVENLVGASMPDVNIVTGWVELKRADGWPVRLTTPLRLDHYTDGQREWLLDRWNAGGGAWLCLKVRSEYFAWDAPAAQKVGFLTRKELIACATHYSPVKPTSAQLCSWFPKR